MSTLTTSALASSPANPSELEREIAGLTIRIDAVGLSIRGPGLAAVIFTPAQALALSDALRGPGARSLIARAWLAEQHAAALAKAA